MDAEITYLGLKNIALQEFPDIVVSASIVRGPLNIAKSLRIFFIDVSFLEIWISDKKYSYHWQRVVIQYPEVARLKAKITFQTGIVGELQKAE